MPALNFAIPAGWGTCILRFEGSPASAHLWGRAGSLCPLLSSCDSSRRHLSPLAWCEHVAEPAQPVGGGSGHPRPFTCCSKSSWRGKASPSHHGDVPSTETQGPVAWKALQGALGLLRPQEGLICLVQIFLHSSCRRSGECHWCQQEGSCPPHPLCEGPAAGEQ